MRLHGPNVQRHGVALSSLPRADGSGLLLLNELTGTINPALAHQAAI